MNSTAQPPTAMPKITPTDRQQTDLIGLFFNDAFRNVQDA